MNTYNFKILVALKFYSALIGGVVTSVLQVIPDGKLRAVLTILSVALTAITVWVVPNQPSGNAPTMESKVVKVGNKLFNRDEVEQALALKRRTDAASAVQPGESLSEDGETIVESGWVTDHNAALDAETDREYETFKTGPGTLILAFPDEYYADNTPGLTDDIVVTNPTDGNEDLTGDEVDDTFLDDTKDDDK